MRITKILVASALVAAIASPVFAQGGGGGGGGRGPQTPEQQAAAFKAADTNGDGKISLAEFTAARTAAAAARGGQAPAADMLKTMFDAGDANKDGSLDATEFASAGRGGRGGRGGGGGGGGGGGQ